MRYKGFTLIEVLIVVILIGILATLLLPQMGTMAERARTAEAKNMIGALRTSLTAHYMEAAAWPTLPMNTNQIINSRLGQSIDTGTSLFNYDITAALPNVTITATRNNYKYSTNTSWAIITLTINNSGGIVDPPGMTTTWSVAAPPAQD